MSADSRKEQLIPFWPSTGETDNEEEMLRLILEAFEEEGARKISWQLVSKLSGGFGTAPRY
jgi:hypothetical protein